MHAPSIDSITAGLLALCAWINAAIAQQQPVGEVEVTGLAEDLPAEAPVTHQPLEAAVPIIPAAAAAPDMPPGTHTESDEIITGHSPVASEHEVVVVAPGPELTPEEPGAIPAEEPVAHQQPVPVQQEQQQQQQEQPQQPEVVAVAPLSSSQLPAPQEEAGSDIHHLVHTGVIEDDLKNALQAQEELEAQVKREQEDHDRVAAELKQHHEQIAAAQQPPQQAPAHLLVEEAPPPPPPALPVPLEQQHQQQQQQPEQPQHHPVAVAGAGAENEPAFPPPPPPMPDGASIESQQQQGEEHYMVSAPAISPDAEVAAIEHIAQVEKAEAHRFAEDQKAKEHAEEVKEHAIEEKEEKEEDEQDAAEARREQEEMFALAQHRLGTGPSSSSSSLLTHAAPPVPGSVEAFPAAPAPPAPAGMSPAGTGSSLTDHQSEALTPAQLERREIEEEQKHDAEEMRQRQLLDEQERMALAAPVPHTATAGVVDDHNVNHADDEMMGTGVGVGAEHEPQQEQAQAQAQAHLQPQSPHAGASGAPSVQPVLDFFPATTSELHPHANMDEEYDMTTASAAQKAAEEEHQHEMEMEVPAEEPPAHQQPSSFSPAEQLAQAQQAEDDAVARMHWPTRRPTAPAAGTDSSPSSLAEARHMLEHNHHFTKLSEAMFPAVCFCGDVYVSMYVCHVVL